MTWLTITEYLCHKWPLTCSVCPNRNPGLFSFMTYHRFCNKSKNVDQELLTLLTIGGVRIARSLDFFVVFCRSLFVHSSVFFRSWYSFFWLPFSYLNCFFITQRPSNFFPRARNKIRLFLRTWTISNIYSHLTKHFSWIINFFLTFSGHEIDFYIIWRQTSNDHYRHCCSMRPASSCL